MCVVVIAVVVPLVIAVVMGIMSMVVFLVITVVMGIVRMIMTFVARFLLHISRFIDVKGKGVRTIGMGARFPGGVVMSAIRSAAARTMRSDLLDAHVPNPVNCGFGEAGEEFPEGRSLDRHGILIGRELSVLVERCRAQSKESGASYGEQSYADGSRDGFHFVSR